MFTHLIPFVSRTAFRLASLGLIQIFITCPPDLEILADPMLEKVFADLLHNSLRYGERVTEIHISSCIYCGGLVVVWER